MNTYYFTYGANHVDRHGRSLGRSYTPIEAEDCNTARGLMFAARGPSFCTHYESAEEAGVERWELQPASLEEVTIIPDEKEAKIDEKLNAHRDGFLLQIETIKQRLANLENIRNIMRRLPLELIPKCVEYSGGLDLEYLSRDESMLAIKSLEAGKWEKSVNTALPGTLDYATTIDGIRVRLWAAGPPQSCRMVEYEEIVPEHTVTKLKMICGPGTKVEAIEGIQSVATEEQHAAEPEVMF